MARPPRIQFPNAVYHVTARGNNRQDIFLDDKDRYSFLNLLAEANKHFNLHIFAFCLMSNHYHLLLRTPEANLAVTMHWINSTYTVRFHRRYGQCGHLLQGRYKSVLVVDEAHWLHLSMYIHLNPVRAGIVDDPGWFVWSSFCDYSRHRPRFDWLVRDEILNHYGATEASSLHKYREECLTLAGTSPAFLEQLKSGVVLGSREKVNELLKKYLPKEKPEGKSVLLKLSRPAIDMDAELKRVSKAFGLEVDDLRRRRKNSPARLAVYYHLVERCGMSMANVAKAMGVSINAVSKGIMRFKEMKDAHKEINASMSY